MRCDANNGFVLLRHSDTGRFYQAPTLLKGIDEALLLGGRRLSAEAAMSIKHRQQGETNAGRLRRLRDALAELSNVAIVVAARIAMDIVKLANARESTFQHLDVGLGGNGLKILRRHPPDEVIH